ncbi:MAG: putative sulfate exporter family transporter [Erysipelotrichaceae bacterium]|nr:putative sulfate exporter family transporter [Erysipelotrichaceae bacterium]MDD3809629.1 putative sulfate exporter family transporter [Erysipelotrichaceae bacterium]
MELNILTSKIQKITALFPGIMLCTIIAAIATCMGSLIPTVGAPLFGIILGIIANTFIFLDNSFSPGIAFSGKKILQWAVILLGFKLSTKTIVTTGLSCLPVIIATITVALATAFLVFKAFKIPEDQAILIGIGSCICGGSAIAAGAATINAKKEDITISLGVIFLFNIIAALIFPALGDSIHLSNAGFALFAGTAVNDTSSVTATALAWDQIHQSNILGLATAVKLTRTLAIIPITLILGIVKKRQTKESLQLKGLFPTFILYFLMASAISSYFTLSPATLGAISESSSFLIVMAMGAIGLNTRPKSLITNAKKPILMGLIIWINIIITSLAVQWMIGIN